MHCHAYDGLGFGQSAIASARRRVLATPRAAQPGVVRRLQVTRVTGPQTRLPTPTDMLAFEQTASATSAAPLTTTATVVPGTNAGAFRGGAAPLFMVGSFPVTPTTAAAGVGGLLLLARLALKKR